MFNVYVKMSFYFIALVIEAILKTKKFICLVCQGIVSCAGVFFKNSQLNDYPMYKDNFIDQSNITQTILQIQTTVVHHTKASTHNRV